MSKTTDGRFFRTFAPIDLEESIKKSDENPNEKSWYVKGYATTMDLDRQDDIMLPEGLDISNLLEHGYINYEHEQAPEFRIGVPTRNTYVDPDKGLYLEGKLYKGNPHAKSIWNLANNIQKSGIDRRLGFSVEGIVRKRNSEDSRIIEHAVITNVALTTSPANPQATWEGFMKSYLTGTGITPETQINGGALRAESLAQSLHQLSYVYKNLSTPERFQEVWEEVGDYLDTMDKYTPESAVMFLQLSKGVSRSEAMGILSDLYKKTEKEVKA